MTPDEHDRWMLGRITKDKLQLLEDLVANYVSIIEVESCKPTVNLEVLKTSAVKLATVKKCLATLTERPPVEEEN